MFPTQSKVYRTSGLWLLPVIALALLLVGYAVFAASKAQAQGTPTGDVCVEGIVIDWEEKPLAGWVVTLTSDISGFPAAGITTTSAAAPEDDDHYYDKNKSKKYPYEYPEVDPKFEKGEFKFSEDDITNAVGPDAGVQTGTFTATIETREGWEGVTPTTLTFDIDWGKDGCAKIRFKMRRIVRVEVIKIDADHVPLADWTIQAVPGPGNLFATPQEEKTSAVTTTGTPPTDTVVYEGGTAVFTLTPGLWLFEEQAPKQDMDEAPNAYRPVIPPNGRQELLIDRDIPVTETITIVFKNQLVTGCFVVRKLGFIPPTEEPIDPEVASLSFDEYNVAGWGFQLLRKDGSVARQGVTDASGELRFDNLPLGPYVLVEEDRPGWDEAYDPANPTMTGRKRDILVEGNLCGENDPVVEFRNVQDTSGFCVEGRKIDANGGWGLSGWEIAIKPLETGDPDPANVFTGAEGDFTIEFPVNDYRVPGSEYEICELGQDGWLPHTPTCQTVRLPEWPGACVQLEDFVNQQVGHSESEDHGKGGKGDDHGKGDYPEGGPGPENGGPHCSEYHIVQAGEGLFEIGRQYDRTPQEMLDANPSVKKGNEMWVFVGQEICIP